MENLGERFHRPRLPRPGGTEEQEDARRPIGRIEAGLIHLNVGRDVLQRARLTDHLLFEQLDEIAARLPGKRRVFRFHRHDRAL